MIISRSTFNIICRSSDTSPPPAQWQRVDGDPLVRPLGPDPITASALPLGGEGRQVNTDGTYVGDLADTFEAKGTSIGMVAANAVQVLAWRTKCFLQTHLSLPGNAAAKEQLEGACGAYIESLRQLNEAERQAEARRSAVADGEADSPANNVDAGHETESAAPSSSSNSRVLGVTCPAIKALAFDGIVAAFLHVTAHLEDFSISKEDAAAMVAGGRRIFEAVLDDSFEGAAVASRPSLDEWLLDWQSAHSMCTLRNTAGAHPLLSLGPAQIIVPLYEQAAAQQHPVLRGLGHLLAPSVVAVQEHLEDLEKRAKELTKNKRKIQIKTELVAYRLEG